MKTRYADIPAYVTRDGSTIRELLHPSASPVRNQSLAEAVVEPGGRTLLHRHLRTEEIYHVTAGSGTMVLGDALCDWRGGQRADPAGDGPLRGGFL